MTLTNGKLVLASEFRSFNPSDIETALWLDAADASTITESGGLVDQIDDKSGNSRNFTATSTARPTYTTSGQNGKNVLTFNGTSNFLSRSEYTYGTTHSLFVVFKYTGASTITASTAGAAVLHGSNSITSIYIGPWSGVFANERLGYYRSSSGFAKTNADINSTSPLLLSFAVNNSLTNATSKLNGSADFLTTSGTSIPSSIQFIGAFDGTSNFFPGLFCELIIAPSFLSATDVEKTEGYLAHKWGLTANLPANHPYKTVEPTP